MFGGSLPRPAHGRAVHGAAARTSAASIGRQQRVSSAAAAPPRTSPASRNLAPGHAHAPGSTRRPSRLGAVAPSSWEAQQARSRAVALSEGHQITAGRDSGGEASPSDTAAPGGQ